MKQTLLLLSILLLCSTVYADTIKLSDSDAKIYIGKHSHYYIDTTNTLTIDALKTSNAFIPYHDDHLKFGFSPYTLWIKFTVLNKSSTIRYLEIPHPHLDHLEFYTLHNNRLTVIKTGDYLPFKSREIDHRHFVFTLKQSETPITYFLKMRSSGYLTTRPLIVSEKEFNSLDDFELAIIWCFFGIMLILAVYNFLVFLSVREKEYLYYVLLNLTYAVHVLACKGLFFQYFLYNYPEWHNISSATLLTIVGIFTLQFSKYFLELSKNNVKLYYLINIQVVTTTVLLVITLITKNAQISSILWISYILTLLLLCVYAFYKAIRGSRSNMFYFFSGTLAFFGILSGSLYSAKGIDLTYMINIFSLQVGGVFHTIFLSIGLADKINTMRKNLLDLTLNLEKKVQEKTEELRITIDELEAMNENLIVVNKELDFAHQTMQKDMEMAINVQTNFLPLHTPQTKNWELAFHFQPMAGVSGDFYDFYVKDDTLQGLALFDVSGHGIASGLITMIAKSILYRNFINGLNIELNQVMENANKELQAEISSVNNYLTGIVLRLHENNVTYVNAGHPDLYLKTKNTAYPVLNAKGESIASFYLGVENLALPFEELTIQVNHGDCVVMFSDCLTEARDASDNPYNTDHLLESIIKAPAATAQELLNFILRDFYTFLDRSNNLPDDLTIIVAKKID